MDPGVFRSELIFYMPETMFTLRNSRHNLDLELGQELDDSDFTDISLENIYSGDEFNTDSQELDDSDYNNNSSENLYSDEFNTDIESNLDTTAAYQDLIQILFHPKFEKSYLTSNLQGLKRQRKQLPLMKIQSHMVPVNVRNTPLTIKDSTRVYFFSLIEHLQRILKNLFFSSQLYFGSGIFSKSCEELWEGDLWAESPLFGQSNLITAQGSFNCGDFVQYRSDSKMIEIGRIRSFIIVDKKIAVRIQ
ncbi:hypothetical protein C2G38_2035934 [Gigaspora rosea]|uniref:Uncharacterized protein n=1 Tax=Gigaspora rosea TaxID=44941 RepID=A0A397VCZ2_9GLOM|nr:hypothetical protein C2G38_2035934 [Gigaspora rosea]